MDEISILGIPGYTIQGLIPLQNRLGRGITDQQRNIRSGMNLSFENRSISENIETE
jgi:hypothetical protein